MPSVSTTLSTDPFSNAERVDIRRFCGYPLYGPGASGFVGFRFFQAYGFLEYRMTNMATEELQNVRMFLSDLYTLEQAITGAAPNLDVAQAAVYTRNKAEMVERRGVYDYRRTELCNFMGVPPGPGLTRGSNSIVI